MASPCTNNPDEVIEKVVEVKGSADKFNKFVNGDKNETVQLGTGDATPTIKNVVNQFKAKSVEFAQILEDSVVDVEGMDLTARNAVAAGSSTHRTLAIRFADLVNVKDYGAKGDGVTDDTAAWTAWQTALQTGGMGYIPSGDYLVNGTVLPFTNGCLGNGIPLVWDSYMTGSGADDAPPNNESFFKHTGTKRPIILDHRLYNGHESWSPQIEISYDTVCDENFDWTTNSPGPMGIEIKGTNKGIGNAMSVNLRSVIESRLDGDGDAVAISGRAYKYDPENGINNSDSCGVHCSAICDGSGEGMVMGSEHWALCNKVQGGENHGPNAETFPNNGTAYSNLFYPGGVVAQHIVARGRRGMVQAGLLFNAESAGPYGMWAALAFNNNIWKFNNNNKCPENTTVIKCATMHSEACPESFMYLGWCPKHIKVMGGFDFNISANWLKKSNNSKDQSSFIVAMDQFMDGSDQSATPATGFAIAERTYGGIPQAPSIDGTQTILWEVYHERNNANTFYRALGMPSTHHCFIVTDDQSAGVWALNIFKETVRPGRDNEQQLGDSAYRWKEIFAGNGTINTSDERAKSNIESPDDALMRVWGRVNFKVFQMKDAIEKKGASKARLHVGVIAQQVAEAFAAEGLDAGRYGLFCHDSWDAKERKVSRRFVEDEMEKRDDDGNLLEPARGHYEDFVEEEGREAGDLYSIRYDEALALECAYQRWRLEQIEARLNEISGNSSAPSGASPDNL